MACSLKALRGRSFPLLPWFRPVPSIGASSVQQNQQLKMYHDDAGHPKRPLSRFARQRLVRGRRELGSHPGAASQSLVVEGDHLVLQCHEGGEGLKLPYYWLRDNCRCSQCFHPSTNQLLHNIVDLDLKIRAMDVHQSDTGVNIAWGDGHRSTYPLEWLRDHAPGVDPRMKKITHWKGGTFKVPSFSLTSLRGEAGALKSLLQTVDEYGVSLIEGVGSSDSDLEELANMVAGVQSTFYNDGIATAQPGLQEADTGYTNLSLTLHTDNTYFSQPCRGLLIQITERDGQGGRTVLTDGFYAIERLANRHPEFFEILCREDLIGQYLDGDTKDFRGSGPVIRVNPRTNQVECLRFNPLDRAPISHIQYSDLKNFYKAYQALAREIYEEENSFKILPRPNQAVLFDNWRVLHGRESFTGHRVLKSAYLRHDDWMSNMRVIGQLPV